MNRRMLTVVSLGLLLIQSTLLSQERAAATASQARIVRIMEIRNRFPEDVALILKTIYGGAESQFVIDKPLGRLIVHTTAARMAEIEQLVAELDAAGAPASQKETMLCRVYMVELLPKQSGLRSFRAELLVSPSLLSLPAMVKAAEGKEFMIDAFRADGRDSTVEMEGRTASMGVFMEVLKGVLGEIPPDGIVKMELDEKAHDLVVPAAQVRELSEPLRQHIQKLLGAEAKTVGYWFGTMSSPGEIEAPIGPWVIQLEVKPSQANGLSIDVGVGEWRGDSTYSILSNSIQAKVGKPIIIGYNRDSFGVRTMGAMVILLEADTVSGDEPQNKRL